MGGAEAGDVQSIAGPAGEAACERPADDEGLNSCSSIRVRPPLASRTALLDRVRPGSPNRYEANDGLVFTPCVGPLVTHGHVLSFRDRPFRDRHYQGRATRSCVARIARPRHEPSARPAPCLIPCLTTLGCLLACPARPGPVPCRIPRASKGRKDP